MPIYAYKCAACGHAKDVLQKMSDAPLSVCPACGAASFQKQLTAAGFQLKGSGWYATDFRNGNATPAPAGAESAASGADGAGKSASDSGVAAPAPSAAPVAASAASSKPTGSMAPAPTKST
jgi:putative FmdB family regulatory protein